jgi:hypothetical protein
MRKKDNHHNDLSAGGAIPDDMEPDAETLRAEQQAARSPQPASRWTSGNRAEIFNRIILPQTPPEPKPETQKRKLVGTVEPPLTLEQRRRAMSKRTLTESEKLVVRAKALEETTPTVTHERRPMPKTEPKTKHWGSKCLKHKAGLIIWECLVCEYAKQCKGYPASFQMVPKIVELVLPIIKGNDFKVWYYIFSTMGTDKWNKEKYLQSYVSNIKIELATGVKNKHLAENYKRLEDANLLRKQTDDVFYKSGPKKGKFKNRRNHFSFNCFFEDYLKLKALNDKLLIKHGRGETALKQRDRTNFVLSQRALRDRKTTK